MRLSLRSRITALFLGLILGFGAIAVVSFYALTQGQIERAIRHDVESTRLLMDRLLHEKTAYLLGQTRLIADLPTFKSAIVSGNTPTVEDRAKVYLGQVNADGFSVTDRNGLRITSGGLAHRLPVDLSQDPGVAQAMDGRDWTGIRVVDGRLMLMTTVPILVGSYPQGTLTAYSEIGAETATRLKESLSTDVAFTVGSSVTGSSLGIKTGLGLPNGVPKQIVLNGVTYVALKAPLPGAAQGDAGAFVVLRDRADLAGAYDQFVNAFTCILILSSLAAFLAAGRFARQITSPLGGVVAAAKSLRAGEWPERFEVTRHDEIGILQGTFNEMTEAIQEGQRKLLSMIDCDPLTELDNHRRFKETIESETARAIAASQPLSLVLIDIDRFGEYNERYGHAAGDELLRSAARLIQGLSPAIAHVARQSGDGFSVTLPLNDIESASELADRLRIALESLDVTASCGCAEVGPGTSAGGTLLLAAEIALTRAKQLGGNQIGRFDKVAGAEGATDPHELNEYLQDASLATIQALAAAVDAKDHYTRGHSQRVAEYASRLCAYIGGSAAEVDLTFRTGTLHDVGKIGV
ncbi:MAG TPA: diguanylate cyclase, partial [Fimbriimonadaceae bacterium]|nr:diguanylate cyclase [Fimbriimonadaceae bacterium]